jgi:hypothetical protein
MGLLDDAIREHLELKRLRGADPGEVAREQREALDPVPRDGRHGENDRSEDDADATAMSGYDAEDVGEVEIAVDGIGEENEHDAAQPGRDADFSNVGQETAELDMRTVLGEEPGTAQGSPARSWPLEEHEESGGAAEDVLEETPDFLRDTPEQDRLWFEQQPPRDFDFDK